MLENNMTESSQQILGLFLNAAEECFSNLDDDDAVTHFAVAKCQDVSGNNRFMLCYMDDEDNFVPLGILFDPDVDSPLDDYSLLNECNCDECSCDPSLRMAGEKEEKGFWGKVRDKLPF